MNSPGQPLADEVTLDDVRREFADRWDIAAITAGYKATIREPGGTPIPRYGRTPAELAESHPRRGYPVTGQQPSRPQTPPMTRPDLTSANGRKP